jgi:integrase
MSVYHDKVCFDICTLLKTSRPGRQNPRVVLSMFDNPRLCVVTTRKEYVKRTIKLKKSSLLFVSFITYQAVCTITLASWLKCVLSLSGINSSFTAHSFRSASTSYAFNKGVSIKTIMDTANWASAQTFYKHYYKTVNSNSTIFSNVILG